MSPRQYTAPSVRQLSAVVDQLAPSVGADRLRQLRMVVGMFDRAVERSASVKIPTTRAADLFDGKVLRTFWSLAVAGNLRHFDKHLGQPLPQTTQRILRDCLLILARHVLDESQELLLPMISGSGLKDTVKPGSAAALYRKLVDLAGAGRTDRDGTALSFEDRTRLLAMVAVVLDAGPRSGELAAMRLNDLTPGETAVAVRRRQQRAGPNRAEEIAVLAEVHADTVRAVWGGQVERMSEATRQRVLAAAAELGPLPETEWYPLREGTRVAVRRWLAVREQVVDRLPVTGARTALWVTLRESKAGPAGITIRAQGLRQAYARGITALNVQMAGAYGWEPLPTTMEQLRRAVDAVPLDGPPE